MEKGPIDQTYPKMEHDLPPPYYPNLNVQGQGQGQEQGPQVGFIQQPPMQTHSNPAVIQMVQILNLGPQPTRMQCPHCGADIETRVAHNPGRMTHLMAVLICLICWPCVCVPYCIDDCMDAEHDCPNCNKHIGTYKR